MSLSYHPEPGHIVICDFSAFEEPEMTKRRPCIVISPKFTYRDNLCTIVPLSTKDPIKIMPYHYKLEFQTPLCDAYPAPFMWVKGDMLTTVGFHRLNYPHKKVNGQRKYIFKRINPEDLKNIKQCILHGIGMQNLIQHL